MQYDFYKLHFKFKYIQMYLKSNKSKKILRQYLDHENISCFE